MPTRLSLIAIPLALLLSVMETNGQDFRMESDVFRDKGKQPVAQYLTLFHGDITYDFVLQDGEEVFAPDGTGEATMFDVPGGRVVLLDPSRRVKSVIKLEELLEFTRAVRDRGTRSDSRLPKELFLPKFERSFDDKTQTLSLLGDKVTYRATGTLAKVPIAAQRFRVFADWSSRLNAVRPGNLPPFARLMLNQELANRELVPERIERTVIFPRPIAGKRVNAHTQHLVTWTLSGTDRKRIDNIGRYLAEFREVSLADYLRIERVAAR